MHLNALYREAQAGKAALVECIHALTRAARWDSMIVRPVRYWTLRQAQRHYGEAKQRLETVRKNIRATTKEPGIGVDSSGGYAVSALLVGGILDGLVTLAIDSRVDGSLAEVKSLLADVDQLLLRLRKAGAVG
ncbi:MAG: hypothetical protein H0X17_20310 [Deltaproteobacteria bacterium]|nr:hypothetical protein [Deltaproteobacteria bacterium]